MIEEQRRLAHTDTLTRLPNREAWTNRLQQEYQRW
jgi:GGDEF domain-containing protein